ncbi:MAG TPA: A24 family peptidase C-terminal domain-containing protein [Methanobacterium sp.]
MVITIPLIATIIAILACFYASYTDLKSGIISNKLTFPLIGLGIVLNGVYAFMIGNIWFIIGDVIITAVIFALGYLFWKIGAWAGGDVKLFTAIAALLPFYPLSFTYTFFNVQFPMFAGYPFPFTLIINSILAMLPFLLIYVIYIALKSKKYLIGKLLKPVKDYRKNMVLTVVITSAITITIFITPYLPYQIIIISLILIYLLTLVISKLPNFLKAIIVLVVVVFALYENIEASLIGIIVLFLSITLMGVIKELIINVSREALQDDYQIQDLKEGMISAYNLYEREGKVYVDDKGFFQRFRESFDSGDISRLTAPRGKVLISSLAAGLTQNDLDLLKKLSKEGKIGETFRTKKGVPFAPSIFIGLLISLFIGDLALIFMNFLNEII